MARSTILIYNQILTEKAAKTELSGLTSPSQVAIWRLWAFITASAINIFEQLLDVFTSEIETIVNAGVPGTSSWVRNEILKFQYSAATPQIAIVKSDFTIGYTTVDTTLNIITNCAVVPANGIVNIKVAKGTTPVPLSSLELAAVKSYADIFMPAGAIVNFVNVAADTLRVNAVVYYNGQYSATIQAVVELALTTYMNTLPFNGTVKSSDIQQKLRAIPGVTDITISQITATPTGGDPIDLILASTELVRSYQTYSGYIVNDPSNLFATTITYTVG